jgi:hypothetical protein
MEMPSNVLYVQYMEFLEQAAKGGRNNPPGSDDWLASRNQGEACRGARAKPGPI